MHLRTEDLLSIHERAVDARWQAHIEQCSECAARLEEINRTRNALRNLPMLEPSSSWSDIQARMNGATISRGRNRAAWIIGAAVAASVACVAVLVGTQQSEHAAVEGPELLTASPSSESQTTTDVVSLIERSRKLDALLQTMPERPRVERVGMAATLDTMEERIQWLDYQLSYAADDLDEMQSQRLWQERVELMDSLVKVRYAQARTASF
jgi:hypothetical protein